MAQIPVSVLLPVFNAERYLLEALQSLTCQTFADFEIVAVNDGSPDKSLDLLHSYKQLDSRLVIIDRGNTGIVGALNDGLNRCRGAYIMRMDADDISYSTRLEIQLKEINRRTNCVAIGSSIELIDPEGDPIAIEHAETDRDRLHQNIRSWTGRCLCHPSVLMRTDAVRSLGGYRSPGKHQNIAEDADLWERLLSVGDIANVDDVLLKYRLHHDSISHRFRHLQADARIQHILASGMPHIDSVHVRSGSGSVLLTAAEQEEFNIERWSRAAIAAGNYRTARKWAFRLLRKRPMSRRKIRLMSEAFLGTRTFVTLARVYSPIKALIKTSRT